MNHTKPKKLNSNGTKFHNFRLRELKTIEGIDRKKGKPKPAERNILDYPTETNENGRLWSF